MFDPFDMFDMFEGAGRRGLPPLPPGYAFLIAGGNYLTDDSGNYIIVEA